MAEPDYTFTVDVLGWDPATRRIWGRASAPVPDGENEIIEPPALKEALPDFLALPVLMWNHTDRPVGLAPQAWFEDDQFYIDGNLKPTSDCDDLAARMDAGERFQFSISAKRRAGSPSCRLPPEARVEPCRTTALDLYSISLCPRGTAQNPTTFCEIRKAFCRKSENPMPDEDMTMNPPGDEPQAVEEPAAPEGQITLTAEAVALIVQLVKDALAAPAAEGDIEKGDDDPKDDQGDDSTDDDQIQKAIRKAIAPLNAKITAMEKQHKADLDQIRKAKVPKFAVQDPKEAQKGIRTGGNVAVLRGIFGGGNA
jgi:hypothetical protein